MTEVTPFNDNNSGEPHNALPKKALLVTPRTVVTAKPSLSERPKERFPDPNESGPAMPFPMLLCLFIGGAIAVSFIALFFVTQHYEERTVRDLGEAYVLEVQRSLTKDVTSYFRGAKEIVRSYGVRLSFDNTSWLDYEYHRRQLADLVLTEDTPYFGAFFADKLDHVFLGLPDGFFEVRSPTQPVCPGRTISGTLTNFTAPNIDCYDSSFKPSQRPWFTGAQAVSTQGHVPPVWSDLYTYSDGDAVGVTVSVGIVIDGQFVGAAAVDILGENIQKYVRQADVPDGTELFIADDYGNLVATRRTDVPMSTGSSDNTVPIKVSHTQHAEMYAQTLLDSEGTMTRHVIGGTAFYTTQRKVPLPSDPYPSTKYCTLHVAVPEASFTHILDEGRKVAIGVTVGVGSACIIVVAVYVYVLARPIARVAVDLERVANLELEEIADSLKENTRVSEVRRLRRSFAVLVRQLIEYRAYMPRSLLALVGGGADDDPVDDEEEDDDEEALVDNATSNSSFHSARQQNRNKGGGKKNKADNGSSVSSGTRSVSARDVGHASTAYIKALNLSRPTVVVMNMRDTHATCRSHDFAETYGTHMTAAVNHVQAYKGVPMFVFGDFLVSTFNAVKKCATKERSACMSAVGTMREVPEAFTMGMSTGQALCGDLRATSDMRSFAVLGAVVNEAFLLQRMNRRLGTSVLMSGGMYAEASLECTLRVRDIIAYRRSQHGRCVVVELVDAIARDASKDEEWMYSLEASADPLKEFNDAVLDMASVGPSSTMVPANNFLERYESSTQSYEALDAGHRQLVVELRADVKRLMELVVANAPTSSNMDKKPTLWGGDDRTLH
eukprot:PhM_4_TR18808/c0_g1_i2/m.91473